MDNIAQQIEDLQQQLIEMQIHFTHQERTIQALDSVIQEQYKEIELLKQQQKTLKDQLEGLQNSGLPSLTQYEKPPHY